MKKMMQMGIHNWSMIHLQCRMTKKNRDELLSSSSMFSGRDWGVVLDLNVGDDLLKEILKLTPEFSSFNSESNNINYVRVTGVSLPDWGGEIASALAENGERAIGIIEVTDGDNHMKRFFLQPGSRTKVLAHMIQLAYPDVMI